MELNQGYEKDISDANKAVRNRLIPVLKSIIKFKDAQFICLENIGDGIGKIFD